MTQSILSSLFALPPPGHRTVPALAKLWFARIISGQSRYDNVFVYYLVLRTSYFVGFFFFLLNVLSQVAQLRLNFHLFAIDLRGAGFVKTFVHSYSYYTASALLLLVIPYYLVVWSNNFESMVCSSYISRGRRKVENFAKYIFALCFFVFAILLSMYGSFGIFGLLMLPHNYENSYVYFVFCGIAWPAVLALMNVFWFIIALSFFFDLSKAGP